MAFYFSLFAYSCDMRKILEKCKETHPSKSRSINKSIVIINLIDTVLNRFSKKVFNKIIEIPEISYMIQHYLHQSGESIENSYEYQECIDILDKKSKKVLITSKDPEKIKLRAGYYIEDKFFLF